MITTTTTEYTQYFTTKTRTSNKEKFIALVEDSPADLQDLVRDIHMNYFNGCLTNDWIFEIIYEAFEELEVDELDDITIETDAESKCAKWFYNNYFASDCCDEYIEEFGHEFIDTSTLISDGQWLAKNRIYDAVNDFINENKVSEALERECETFDQVKENYDELVDLGVM